MILLDLLVGLNVPQSSIGIIIDIVETNFLIG